MKQMLLLFLLLAPLSLSALPFSGTLTEQERQDLAHGAIVMRNLGAKKPLSLTANHPMARQFTEKMKRLKPIFCMEVMQIRPYKGNEDLTQLVKELVTDLPRYLEIPYYSVQYQGTSPLFSVAEQTGLSITGGRMELTANLKMDPFSLFETKIEIRESGDALYFMAENTERIKYSVLTAVKPHQMHAGLVIIRTGDTWVLYAAGGVHAGFLFFFQNRIEQAFVNRIKDFTTYFITQL